ncbi:hypothetical protein BH09PSE2_BH09PSE2_10480 [soil metagenome]
MRPPLAILSLTAAVVLACFGLTSGAASAQAPLVSDPTLKAYMKAVVDPAANAFFAGGNDAPAGETPARADPRCAKAVEGAVALKAAAGRLQTPEFLSKTAAADWSKWSKLMAEAVAEGEAAVRAKKSEVAMDVGGKLYDSCNGCHHQFQPGH